MAQAKLVSTAILQYYDTKLKSWVGTQITGAVAALGDVLTLKGRVDDKTAPNAITNPKDGDVYLVGAEGASEFEEYYYYGSAWEFMGTTAMSLYGYVDEKSLYKGEDGSGTTAAPAAGTILAPIVAAATALTARVAANEDAITAINKADTGILAQAKKYTDDEVKKVSDKVTANTTNIQTNTDAIAAINNETTGILAQAKTYADSKSTDLSTKVTANEDAIKSINDETTGILALSKKYTGDEVKKVDDKVTANTTAIAAINNETTGAVATSKSYTDTELGKVSTKVTANTDAITAINDTETGAVATAKSYTDTKVAEVAGAVANIAEESDIDAFFA